MTTKAEISFTNGRVPLACVYRHADGYPDSMLKDLERFLDDVETQAGDTRFGDPSYLAAKYVVWQAGEYQRAGGPLDFSGVAVVAAGSVYVHYHYFVACTDRAKRPEVTCTDQDEDEEE